MKEEAKRRRVDFWWWWWCCWANECCWTGWKKNVISVNSLNVASSLTLLRARELVEWGRMCQQRWVRWVEQCWNGEREPRWKNDTTEDNSRTLLYFSALSLLFFLASLHQLLNHRRCWNNKRIFSARCKFLIFSNVSDVGDLLWSFNTQLSLISFARPCGSSSTAARAI